MSETSSSMSPALKLALKAVVNVLLVWGMNAFLPSYFSVFGGLPAYVIIGSLLTLMNMFLRPLLAIVTFPLHLLFTLFTIIGVNAFFVFVIYEITLKMDPAVVAMAITGGLTGWLIVSCILGLANWIMKHVF
ncbi:MAG: phage holin family protein [Candidatus Peribacteraceae bacterium]|nr:phage holin family protein [Candidatus Peribacteraceae bacterium]